MDTPVAAEEPWSLVNAGETEGTAMSDETTRLEDMVAMMKVLKKDIGMTERESLLIHALKHWVFMYRWKVDGMNVEQARIHADCFVEASVRSLPPYKDQPQ